MIERFEATGRHDRRLAQGASGLLASANQAGVLEAGDVHLAARLAELAGERDEQVVLATALASRAARQGSVCLDLRSVTTLGGEADQEWPDPQAWLTAVRESTLARAGVLVIEHDLVYLQHFHHQEVQVCQDVLARLGSAGPSVRAAELGSDLAAIFPGAGFAEQRTAATAAADRWTTVLTGGPGTGKTTTVAGVLAALAHQAALADAPFRVALAAPTGKAAARLQEATVEALARVLETDLPSGLRAAVTPLQQVQASTLHRLLGTRPGPGRRFGHDRRHRLPHDVVVVDESSMISLSLMARLLAALRPETRLLLVGDPDQLASVEAGAVLADLVAGLADHPADPVVRLSTVHRYGAGIAALAQALRDGDADATLAALRPGSDVELLDPDGSDPGPLLRTTLTRRATELRSAALAGDTETALGRLGEHRLLCAHRDGPFGVRSWNRRIEQWLTEASGDPLYQSMYPGRPLLVTANDYGVGVFNGDTGVVVDEPDPHGAPGRRHQVAVVSTSAGEPQRYAVGRLGDVETMHAMTVHKAQGSQARHVTVLLPDGGSRLLTRELLYTAVTRAQDSVRLVGSPAVVRDAVERPVVRASGLRQRLTAPGQPSVEDSSSGAGSSSGTPSPSGSSR